MVIADAPALLFVHIPKTAGLSITELLAPEGRRDHPLCLPKGKHESLSELCARHGEAVLDRFHVFTIVRDPLQRFISHFCWLKGNRRLPDFAPMTLEDFARSFENPSARQERPRRYMTQADFVCVQGRLRADTRLRCEALSRTLLPVLAAQGLQRQSVPRRNASVSAPPAPSRFVRGFVADYYREDYRLFGYTPP